MNVLSVGLWALTVAVANAENPTNGTVPSNQEVDRRLAPYPDEQMWTQWYDRDDQWGTGDYEQRFQMDPLPCDGAMPVDIECQTVAGVDFRETGDVLYCTPSDGLLCLNKDQKNGKRCQDYKVRFQCPIPSAIPSNMPSQSPSMRPSISPTGRPSQVPSASPSMRPSMSPTGRPSQVPSSSPSMRPSISPTGRPSQVPSASPSTHPSGRPSQVPSQVPSRVPSVQPSTMPSMQPSDCIDDEDWVFSDNHGCDVVYTIMESQHKVNDFNFCDFVDSITNDGKNASEACCVCKPRPDCEDGSPSCFRSKRPTPSPTQSPSFHPSSSPTGRPSGSPSMHPSSSPTERPSGSPSMHPSPSPTGRPSGSPSMHPSSSPTGRPSGSPSMHPSSSPSRMWSGVLKTGDYVTLQNVGGGEYLGPYKDGSASMSEDSQKYQIVSWDPTKQPYGIFINSAYRLKLGEKFLKVSESSEYAALNFEANDGSSNWYVTKEHSDNMDFRIRDGDTVTLKSTYFSTDKYLYGYVGGQWAQVRPLNEYSEERKWIIRKAN